MRRSFGAFAPCPHPYLHIYLHNDDCAALGSPFHFGLSGGPEVRNRPRLLQSHAGSKAAGANLIHGLGSDFAIPTASGPETPMETPARGGGLADRRSTRWGRTEVRRTVEDLLYIRIRDLLRRTPIRQGSRVHGVIPSSRTGPIQFVIDAAVWPVEVELSFARLRGGEWHPESWKLWLLPRSSRVGGGRWWFLCPPCGRCCCELFYDCRSSMIWACRRCFGLTYPTQRESRGLRARRRLRVVLTKAGASFTAARSGSDVTSKPGGMHQRTFDRLRREADVLAEIVLRECRDGRERLDELWG